MKWARNRGWGRRWGDGRNWGQAKNRQPSVQTRPEWDVIEEMDFPRLAKLNLPGVGEGEDV